MSISLFAVVLLPPWQLGEGDGAHDPLLLAQQNAPGLPLMPIGPMEAPTGPKKQQPGLPKQATEPPASTSQFDCIWKVINGRDECYCRPAGNKGPRTKSDMCVE